MSLKFVDNFLSYPGDGQTDKDKSLTSMMTQVTVANPGAAAQKAHHSFL